MDIPAKKLKSGFEIPIFGLGTYGMGGGNDRDPQNNDQKDIRAIKEAIETGVTHIDTAESYAGGHCETLVKEGIKGYNRNKLFIASKVKKENLSYKGIKLALEKSLDRMGTNFLDLYYLHRCPPEEAFEECFAALDELVEQGLIKNIGISNFNTKHTAQAKTISKNPIAATQVHLNLQFREPEKDGLLDYCQNEDVILVAWRPVNKGSQTKTGTNITLAGIPILDMVCKKYDKTPAQISINWLISQANVVTLAKSSNLEHLRENIGAVGWKMEQEDIELLRKEFPGQQTISDTVPLA